MHLITRLLPSLLATTAFSAVVFPDRQNKRGKRQEEVGREILPCPDGQLFCDNISDYPTHINIVDSVVASRLIKNAIFDTEPVKLTEETQLRRSFLKESRACDNRKGTVYPKKAKNIEGRFVFIVNDDQYRQSVEIEQCLSEGEICLNDSDSPLPTTVCRQKYATYRMYVINENGRQVYDSFSLPSACLCHHKSDLAIKNAFKVDLKYYQLTCPPQEELAIQDETPQIASQDQTPAIVVKDPSEIAFDDQTTSTEIASQDLTPEIAIQDEASDIAFNDQTPEIDIQDETPVKDPSEITFNDQTTEIAVKDQTLESSTTEGPSFPDQRKPQRKNSGIQFQERKRREAELPSAHCSNGTLNYCEENDSFYPSEAVLEALASNNEINPELFSQLFDNNCKDLKTRFFDIDEEQLCAGFPKIIFPKQAKNLKDEWRYIVNIDNYTQSVEIEECYTPPDYDYQEDAVNTTDSSVQFDEEEIITDFGSCQYSGSPGNDPSLTVCRQLFTSHKLLSLSSQGQLVVDSFQLPSACACFVREDFLLTFRSDMNPTTNTGNNEEEEAKDDSSEISFPG